MLLLLGMAHGVRAYAARAPAPRASTSSALSAAEVESEVTALMRTHDPILHWARKVMPPKESQAAGALYAWCRRLDEIVDDVAPREEKLRRLDSWRGRVDDLWAGRPRGAFDSALAATLKSYPQLGRRPFDEMLAGMRSDLASDILRYETFRPTPRQRRQQQTDPACLLTYCYRAAGTVGEMLLPVLDLPADDPEVSDAAIALGCAIQLLNICRDVRMDLRLGRIYLPAEDMRKLGVVEADIVAGTATTQYRRLVRLQARRAAALLRRAEKILPALPLGATLLISVIIDLHWEIYGELKARDYDNLSGPRVRVSTLRKALCTVRSIGRSVFRDLGGRLPGASSPARAGNS